jgi:ribosomal protein S18 acetylase RimI-like enzyme
MIAPCTFERTVTGIDVYRIDAPFEVEALRKAVARCPGHIIAKIDAEDSDRLNALLEVGFRFSVGSTRLEIAVIETGREHGDCRIRTAKSGDAAELLGICDEAFEKNNRFANDPVLGVYNREIHRQWLVNSLQGYANQCCGILEEESRRWLGFGTLHLQKEDATIGLLAVARRDRRKGVASAIVRHLSQTAAEAGRRRLLVATESTNYRAVNFYIGRGFRITGAQLALYRRGRGRTPCRNFEGSR